MISRALLIGAVLSVVPGAQGSGQQADYSGLDPFWAVAEMVASDREVPDAAWGAMFATPGYGTLREHDNADRFFERLLPMALSEAHRDEAQALIAEQPIMEMFLTHLRAAYELREELEAFRAELEGRPLLDEALAAAQVWLPAGIGERYGSPAVSLVIYQPDARGYDRIVMDLLVAYEQPEHFDHLLAHETHHVIRAGIGGPRGWSEMPEADLLAALDNLQAEAVADMIDKPHTLAMADWGDGTTGAAMVLITDRFRSELDIVQQRLVEFDAILAAYAADRSAAEELGARLRRDTLVMGGHPVGYHMAGVIVAAGLRDRMIDNVADPFDFVRTYNDAAAADPASNHVFSDAALRGLQRLEQTARRPGQRN
jgi:hypothetical protein